MFSILWINYKIPNEQTNSKKNEQTKHKISKRKEIKIRVETNEMNTKKIQRINKTKSWFYEEISKIDESLAKFKRRREKTQINKSRD
jgi:Mg2+/Co2+ transporter CorB